MKHVQQRLIAGIVIAVIAAIIFLLSNALKAQVKVNNFTVADGDVIWNREYKSTKSFNEVYLTLKSSGEFEKIDTTGNKMFVDIKPFDADYRGAGFNTGNTAMYLSGSHINAFAVITLKDSSYEVQVKKIICEQAYSIGKPGDLLHYEKGERNPIEDYILTKKKEFRANFVKNDSKIINYSFKKKFKEIE